MTKRISRLNWQRWIRLVMEEPRYAQEV